MRRPYQYPDRSSEIVSDDVPQSVGTEMWHNLTMKFRIGLITGLIIGFLLGARAGRERYDQLVAAYNKIRSNELVRRTTDLAEQSTRKTRAAAGNTLVGTADTIRQRAAQ
jgi:hypothetical protein